MPPPPHTKPENVLKRAQELIGVGQSQAALTILHEHVTSKRSRNSPIQSLEPVMLLFLELCVDLKKGKHAKDGLYQYKNTAQNTNVGTIELVLRKFIELSDQKVTEAQAKADEIQSSLEPSASGAANVEDLDAIETPESILLSTVSGEQSKDRTDRAIVTPWLKFLWETYRTVLEILKNNARLEVMYQSTAMQAFAFCQKYARKTEFRRLCELLRNHLQNAAKYSSQMNAINLSDPETLQRHLDTRFAQLNVAAELELWQEAFRSVEDIHNLMSLSKRPAKNIMMANYYEKLTRIFLRSENFLFHAASQNRYFNLLRHSSAAVAAGQSPKKDNPVVSESEITRVASYVLLATLAIPVISTSRSRGALLDADEARRTKNTRLTNLLNMSQAPTRELLLRDALNKGLLKRAKPEIRELYQILEVDFHPLSICKKISPILVQIGKDEEMKKYVEPLQQVILTRLFQQLSQVYESVELSFVYRLAEFPEPYQKASGSIEKFIMNGCKKGDFAIRLDHASGVLTFDSDVFSSAKALHPASGGDTSSSVQRLQATPAEIVRSQLTRLAKTLYITCQYVDPSFNSVRQEQKAAAFARAQAGAEKEHTETLARRAIIEKKKELASDALQKKQKEEETRKRLQVQELAAREAERLAADQRARDQKRREEEQKKARQETLLKEIDELKKYKNLDLGDVNIEDLDSERLRQIRLEQLAKEKNELTTIMKVTAKRIDHLERAFRREEIQHLPHDYEVQRAADLELYEKRKTETLEAAQQKHKEDVALKNRLSRLVPFYENFTKELKEKRHDEFERRRKQADKELEQAISKRKKEVREDRAREKRAREEAERRMREEEERQRQEEEERTAREAEEKQKKEEDRARREEERKALAEKARLQAQREEEALARRKVQKNAIPERPAQPHAEPAEAAGGPPRLNLAGNKPSWRDREKAKQDGKAPEAAADPEAEAQAPAQAEPPKRSGYVPPALRGRTADGAPSTGASNANGSDRPRQPRPTDSANGDGEAPPARNAYVPPSQRGNRDADSSPAPPAASGAGGKYVPRFRRDDGAKAEAPAMDERQGSRSGGNPQAAASSGKYVPRHLRDRQT